ncbi:MAG: PAS-domain containing protein [Pseudomonadales bacterium]
MFQNWQLISTSLAYITLLFVIAYFGDKYRHHISKKTQPAIYALTLGVYCTSWSFLGTTAQASANLFSHLPIFLGPILLFVFAWPFIQRLIQVSLRLKVTSLADLLAARYGKSKKLAVIVTLVALIGTMPYIALQLKAIVYSYQQLTSSQELNIWQTGLVVSTLLAAFTVFFGIRSVDVTERHPGVMLAIAFESLVKLLAFLVIGLFVCFFLYDSPAQLWRDSRADGLLGQQLEFPNLASFIGTLVIVMAAFLALPRQFQVMIVELRKAQDSQLSRVVFPLYLLVFALFAVPLGLAGQLLLSNAVPADAYVLFLPASSHQTGLTLLAFLGAISAASSMVIISSIALSTMLSNEIFFPLLFNRHTHKKRDFSRFKSHLLQVRKTLACVVILLGYLVFLGAPPDKLASLGQIAFGAVAQLAPALLAAFYWRASSLTGVVSGIVAGFSLWLFLNLLPLLGLYPPLQTGGPLPAHLTISLLSLALNIFVMWWVSQFSRQSVQERVQASNFLDWNSPADFQPSISKNIDAQEMQLLASHFIGQEKARQAFNQFLAAHDPKALGSRYYNHKLIQHTEHLLTSVMGSSSSRLVIRSAVQGKDIALDQIALLVENVSSHGTQFSHSLLQSAIENSAEGISVVDSELNLVAWNHRYVELFQYPQHLVYVGCPVEKLIRHNAERGLCGKGDIEEQIHRRLQHLQRGQPHSSEREHGDGKVIRIQGNPLPNGGFVMIFSDISAFRRAEQVLREANQDLETRVSERTAKLEQANAELERERASAIAAHRNKSQFLNACSHDLMQPLEAARLFTSALSQQRDLNEEHLGQIDHIDRALQSASQLLGQLGELAKIESGNVQPKPQHFSIDQLLETLALEFSSLALAQSVTLRRCPSSAWIKSDPQLLRRVLQNLIGNALRYAPGGRVLIGCRRHANTLTIQVVDTGPGIPIDKQQRVFEQFTQLDNAQAGQGLGLGLSISKSFCQLLQHPLKLCSEVGRGCTFSIQVPLVSARAAVQQAAKLPSIDLSGVCVLCIENDPELLQATLALLEAWQCNVLCAERSEVALTLAEQYGDEIDIVLADYQLGGEVDGLTLLAKISGASAYGIPGILMTAALESNLAQKTEREGFSFMRKPIDPETLKALMGRLLTEQLQRDYSLLAENGVDPTSS